MKKLLMNSFVLVSILAASSAFAEWTIPGTNCVPGSINGKADVGTHVTGEPDYKDDAIFYDQSEDGTLLQVICSSPVHNGYGKLDMDFLVYSQNEKISCSGASLDKFGKLIQRTKSVTSKSSPGTVKLSVGEGERLSSATAVTVAAVCHIPKSAKVISVRIY